jgi:N-acetylglucosaminyldiphosphoundecaprenol N-acetyl-beta-D-mannosaminyltransferase
MKRNWKHPISVLGLPLDRLTVLGAVEAIDGMVGSGRTHQIASANIDSWLNSLSDQHLHRIIAGCSLVLPDGMPLVWVSKLLGCPLGDRITGVDLVPRLAELSVRTGYGIYLLGGKGNVVERAKQLLEQKFPGARIVGTYAPSEEELAQLDHSEIFKRIHAAKPEILLVSLDSRKQEKWIWMHRKRLGVPVVMGVGGSLEIIVGDVRRAPGWVQKCGLEWMMRLVPEPARLGPRYFRDFTGFGRRLPLTLLAAWTQRPHLGESHVNTVSTPRVIHVHVHGKLASRTASTLRNALDTAIASNLVMVVHLQAVRQITAAGLGALMDVRRQMLDAGLTLSLAGLTLKHRFLLHAWCAESLFDEWESTTTDERARSAVTTSKMSVQEEQDGASAQIRARG